MKLPRTVTVLVFISILLAGSSYYFIGARLQSTGVEKISLPHLRADFSILRKTLEEAHPGLYWYTGKERMDHYFDSTYALLDHPMSEVDFFKVCQRVIAGIRCVHTTVTPSKQTVASLFNSYKCLPLKVKFFQGRTYISECFIKGRENIKGMEILSINQVHIDTLLKKMFDVLPADGYNKTFKYYLLEGSLFRECYALFIERPDKYVITANDPLLHKRVTFEIPACTQKQIGETRAQRPAEQDQKEIYYTITDSIHEATLTINTFQVDFSLFRNTIHSFFKKLRERSINNLVIDIRNNGGGNNSNVTDLYAYLADGPFRHLKYAEMKTQHFSYIDYVENRHEFIDLYGTLTDSGNYIVNYKYPGTELRNPAGDYNFKGKVFILTSGGTVSAASEFAAIAHSHKRAVLIGEETGGDYYGATGGCYLNLVLPYSRIKVRVPTIRIFTGVDTDLKTQPWGRGVIPDYGIETDIGQYLNKEDVPVKFAMALIRKN